ncbi:hypothetical protein [Enterobacter kobei]|uniref:hypothetical protein n=1 Tax=Enterobacter kobei TaxID=208224 RepID=UPI003CED743A
MIRKKTKKTPAANTGEAGYVAKPRNHATYWTLAEIAFLEKHYGSMPVKDISAELGRSIKGIQGMAFNLGLSKSRADSWSEQEMEILRTHYNFGKGLADVQALLPGRSATAITVRANRTGLAPERHPWTPREQRFLKKHYGSMSVEDIAKTLGRTVRAVRSAVVTYKPDKVKITPRWTEQELAIIRTHYSSNLAYVLSQLPDRTRDAIRVQAIKMNLRLQLKWTDEEEQIVREFYPVMGKKVADKLPGRTAMAIMHCAMRLGLTKRRS